MNEYRAVSIRGTEILLHTYNRSLNLCAQMNYEIEVLEFIDRLSAEDVFYDLGAAEGRFSLYAAAKGIKVIAFEPEKKNNHVFLENLKLNPTLSENITLYQLAVGEKNGNALMSIGQPWAGGHQKVVQSGPGRIDFNFVTVEEQEISIVSLDNFIDSAQLPIPTALKIDVDGSELPFILGAKRTLSNPLLKKIIFELCIVDQYFPIILAQLEEMGYQEISRHKITNESDLYNINFKKI